MRALTALVLVVSSLAFAQSEAPKAKPKPQFVDFGTGTQIGGEREVPLEEIYFVPPERKFSNLIKVRMNFNDKLAASVHEM